MTGLLTSGIPAENSLGRNDINSPRAATRVETKCHYSKPIQTQRVKQLDPQTPSTRFTTSGWQLRDLRIEHNRYREKTSPFLQDV